MSLVELTTLGIQVQFPPVIDAIALTYETSERHSPAAPPFLVGVHDNGSATCGRPEGDVPALTTCSYAPVQLGAYGITGEVTSNTRKKNCPGDDCFVLILQV